MRDAAWTLPHDDLADVRAVIGQEESGGRVRSVHRDGTEPLLTCRWQALHLKPR